MEVDRRYYNKLCRTECIRNSRRVFRLPCRSIKDASVARFVNLKQPTAQTKLRGKSKEGGRSPLLGRFKGDCQGGRVPTRIQRSDSCGKRRNNGTDDACPPLAADRMRDVEFVPTQLPLDYSFFRPSTALSFSYEKESGVENVSFLTSQKKVCRRRHPAPSGAEFFYFPNRSSIIAGTLTTDSSVVRNTPAEAVWLSAWHS